MKNILLLLSLVVCLTQCRQDEPQPKSISDVVWDDPDLTFFKAALDQAGYKDALKTGSLTVFAPTDAAFKAAGITSIAAIVALPTDQVRVLLNYHLLPTKTKIENLTDGNNLPVAMFSGDTSFISKTLLGVSINGIKITKPDNEASNGVIHVIERVLTPARKNTQQIVQENADLSLFFLAYNKVKNAKIDLSTLSGYTLFVPTNKAMETLGFNQTFISQTNPAILSNVVLYHIAKGRYFTTNITTGNIQMIDGRNVGFTNTNGTVTMKGNNNGNIASNIVTPNLLTTNGLVHVIDRVLVP
jgi:uncharacterized surface protein with fasciclin (FAS1) repeats